MKSIDRREFLTRAKEASVGAAAAGALLAAPAHVRAAAPSEKIVLGMVGVGGRGPHLATGFSERGDCDIAYIADVDEAKLESRRAAIGWAKGLIVRTRKRDSFDIKTITHYWEILALSQV